MIEQDANAPYWQVTTVEDTTMYTPEHGVVHAKRVRYRFSDGTQSFIDVPMDKYNAQYVQDTIHMQSLKHEQVMSLAGPPVSMPLSSSTPTIPDVVR